MINEVTITTDAKVICALKLFIGGYSASAINGINLEIDQHESRLIATNGHILVVYRIEQSNADLPTPLRNAIIPVDLLEGIKPKDGRVDITIGLESDGGNVTPKSVTINFGINEVKGALLNRQFPNWRAVIPTETSGEAAQFNPEYISLFHKAWAILNNRRKSSSVVPQVHIGHNGRGASYVNIGEENFFALLMPLHIDESSLQRTKTLPEWVSSQLPPKEDNEA